MEKLFKNKLFVVFLLFFSFIVIKNSNVFAATFYDSDNNEVDVPSFSHLLTEGKVAVLHYSQDYNYNKTQIVLCISDYYPFGSNGLYYPYYCNNYLNVKNGINYVISNNEWVLSDKTDLRQATHGYGDFKDCFIYTSMDINNDKAELVFQEAPLPAEEVKVELMKETQVEEIPQQIVKVVRIVLPTLLTVFGVLLVVFLIKSKNLLQL